MELENKEMLKIKSMNRAESLFIIILGLVLFANKSISQISPPGLGKTNIGSWVAVGIRQELDTIEGKGWQSMSYVGLGRKSNPDNYNPFHKAGIFIANQEFYHQFHKTWQYSLALSYRRQDQYLDNPPYEYDKPNLQQEFRVYARLSYLFRTSRIKIVPTVRQEFRKYFTPDFKNASDNFQFRSRFRIQLSANLDRKKKHRLVLSSEQLFSVGMKSKNNQWTDFNYRESRFSFYYSYSPKTSPFIFNIGYMNNLVGNKKVYTAHYLAFDIILENPFKLQQRNKDSIKENYE